MNEARFNNLFERISQIAGKTSTATTFLLMNGLVIAAVTFGLLFFTAMDVKGQEARAVTGDLVRATEQSISDMEKTIRGLGYYYSSLSSTRQANNASGVSIQKLLSDDTQTEAILWVTDKGLWMKEDLVRQAENNKYDPSLGWPSYNDLYRATYAQSFDKIGYLNKMPWAAFSANNPGALARAMGITIKMRLPDGGVGILMVVTTPDKLFGSSWSAQRTDIAIMSVHDDATGETVLKNVINGSAKGSLANQEVGYPLQSGDKTWTVNYEVLPTTAARLMSWSPWVALCIILALTIGAAFSVERKHRQDLRLEEVSRDLEGAHHELQSSISERDKLFHALHKSERENRAVINSVSDVIFETDENGKLVFLNETWKRITDIEVESTIGASLFSMIEPADRARQRDMFDELVHGERQAYRSETRIDVGNGTLKPVEIAFSMLRMAEDKNLRVVGTITDIEKRRKAEMAMRDAEQRFRAMYENSISGIYQSSPEGRYISVNPAMAEILGYASPAELMDSVHDIAHQIYVKPEESKLFVQKILFEGRISGMEIEVYRKDGKKIWIMENARVVRNDKGGIYCYEGSITDITKRKEAEAAMRNAKLQAEMSSRSRMEFLANMSHELRTPLNAIIGFSEIIKDQVMGALNPPVYREYAKDIYESGNYLLKVISEILEVSKIETGNRELNISTFRLTKALRSCMTIMSSRVEEAGVKLEMDIPDTIPELMAEELGFKQVMLNLIGNAIKFTEKGGHIKVSAVIGPAGEMIIDVADTGIGMSPDEIEKAMQPFAKVDNNFSTMKAGTGLGLTIVDSLVRLHGGEFRIMSEKGKGTTARVIMPPHRVYRVASNGTAQLQVIK